MIKEIKKEAIIKLNRRKTTMKVWKCLKGVFSWLPYPRSPKLASRGTSSEISNETYNPAYLC